jgi:hypothetical protein
MFFCLAVWDMNSTTGCCGQLVVGWRRPKQDAFIKTVIRSSPPPLLPPPPVWSAQPCCHPTTTCGARLQHLAPGSFCSTCYDALIMGTPLSNGEVLCSLCTDNTFLRAEQHETVLPPPPRVALLARHGSDGRILPADVGGVPRHALLLSLRKGDKLQCCGCITSKRIQGRIGRFDGYCVRRGIGLLRIGRAVVGVHMELLHRPSDEATLLHTDMLRTLLRVATPATLRCAITTVRSMHTLCGSPVLAAAEAALAALRLGVDVPPTVCSSAQSRHAILGRDQIPDH